MCKFEGEMDKGGESERKNNRYMCKFGRVYVPLHCKSCHSFDGQFSRHLFVFPRFRLLFLFVFFVSVEMWIQV